MRKLLARDMRDEKLTYRRGGRRSTYSRFLRKTERHFTRLPLLDARFENYTSAVNDPVCVTTLDYVNEKVNITKREFHV